MVDAQTPHADRQRLTDFALGHLDEGDALAVASHLEACDDCRAAAAAVADDTFAELVRASATPPDPLAAPRWAAPAALAGHPRYRVVALLGAGGMGAVFRAEHRLMERTVALKVIKRELTDRPAVVERFRREVKAAARLDHPNIVRAHDAEQAGDTHFLVMECVEGTTLARLVTSRGPLPVSEACDYIRQAALGLHHAYEQGMVHCDVKPHNLMVTPAGQVKILDFGLARLASELSHGESVTSSGMVLGTADYIAPEQAEDPHSSDIRADIYSLGCTLYFLLTGQPPFPEGTLMQKLKAHEQQTPRPVSTFRDDIPPELGRVLDRLLAKKPAARFQMPADAARALTPFVGTDGAALMPAGRSTQETLAIEPPPRRRRARRAVVAALLLVVGIGGWLYGPAVYRFATNQGQLVIETNDEHIELTVRRGGEQVTILDTKTGREFTLGAGKYEIELTKGKDGLKLATKEFTLSRGGKEIVRVSFDPKAAAVEKALRELAGAWYQVSAQFEGAEIRGEDRTGIQTFTGDRVESRVGGAFHQSATVKIIDPVAVPRKVDLVDWSEKGVVSSSGIYKIEGDTLHWCQSFNNAPRPTAFGTSKGSGLHYGIWRRVPPEKIGEVRRFEGHKWGWVTRVAFTPDGRRAISLGDFLRTWEVTSARQIQAFEHHNHGWALAVSPDGRSLVCNHNNTVRRWDLETGKELGSFEANTGEHLWGLAYSPDGKRVLSGGDDQTVRLWEADSGKELRRYEGGTGTVLCVAHAADGRRVAAGGNDNAARVWDADDGQLLHTFTHDKAVWCVTFTPDGRGLLSASGDGTARLWDLKTGKETRRLNGHAGPVVWVAVSPDGRRALTAGEDSTVRLWDLTRGRELHRLEGHAETVQCVTFSPDGRHALSSGMDRTVRLWRLPDLPSQE